MSYDLQVFGADFVDHAELCRLLEGAGLGVDQGDGEPSEFLTAVRGARAKYSFTVGLPVRLEPEDVPEEVTAVLLAPEWLYEVQVEGSTETEVPHAVRFARKLSQAVGGAVLDQQTDQTWIRGKSRAVAAVQQGRIDVVELRWYTTKPASPGGPAGTWLDAARRYLPEALPRRFGSFEPLSMKLEVEGDTGFVEAVTAETMTVFFSASRPCISGSISGGARGEVGVHSHSLSVHRDALADRRWADALQRLFVSFASKSNAVFASAEVQRGVGWSGRSTWFDSEVERTTYLAVRGGWSGLLPYPAWWTWFGSDYVPLVAEHLDVDSVELTEGGLFHTWGPAPLDRDQIEQLRGGTTPPGGKSRRSRWLRARQPKLSSSAPWLPADLIAAVDASDPRLYNPPLIPASRMPESLRSRREGGRAPR